MKLKFERLFGTSAFILLALPAWARGASAQPAPTNAPDAKISTAAAVTVKAAGSNRTGQAVPLLVELKSHEDYLTFGLDEVPFLREHKLFGHPLWKYLASFLYILLAFYVSKFLDFLTNARLKRWSEKTGTKLNELLVPLLRGPVKVVAFVVFLDVGLDIFDWGTAAQSYLAKGFILTVAFSLTYVMLKLIDLALGLWRERAQAGSDRAFDNQLFPVISKSLKLFAVIVAVLVTASNLHINITGALASLSVGALAIGLAAQDTLANLFGAVAVFIDKPFRIGDEIRLEGVTGTVESIGLRSTRLRSPDGHHVTIPNKTVGNDTITNVTRRTNIRTEMNIGLTYDLPAEKVRRALEILDETYRGHPMTADLTVTFNKFTDSSLNILVVHCWKGTDGAAQQAGMQELNLKIKERFDAEGITFAFPARAVYLKQGIGGSTAQK